MHGLNTINELNDLADNNAPGAPEATIAAADANDPSWVGREVNPDPVEDTCCDTLAEG